MSLKKGIPTSHLIPAIILGVYPQHHDQQQYGHHHQQQHYDQGQGGQPSTEYGFGMQFQVDNVSKK